MKRFMSFFIAIMIILNLSGCNGKGKKSAPDSGEFHWEYTSPESQGFSSQKLNAAVKVLSQKNTKKLIVVRNDKIVCEWFAEGFGDSIRGHSTASLAKAIVAGVSLLGAMDEGTINPDDFASQYIPSWADDKLKSKITIRHLATHTSGMEDSEVSLREQRQMAEQGLNKHMDLKGWKGHFWRKDLNPFVMARDSAPILAFPGTRYGYSNPGIGMLTYTVTSSLRNSQYKDIHTLLREKIYGPIGIDEDEYTIGYGKSYEEEGLKLYPSWGGGTFTARATARIGRLLLNKGMWQGKQIIKPSLVAEVISYKGTPLPASRRFENDTVNQRNRTFSPSPATTLGWYCNFDKVWKNIPPDAFCGAGNGNQHLFVVPSLNLIIVRYGGSLASNGESSWYAAEKYLFSPIVEAIK